ncbi:hypothetical protein BGZ76_008411 [Entomortierella beljakovae]|nr:hypothetical protein BGZ76_008411 [Entomortierella beljakovae]
MDAKKSANSEGMGTSHSDSKAKGKETLQEGTGSETRSGGVADLVGSIMTSASTMASAVDPRRGDPLFQLHNSTGSGSSNVMALGSASKASTSSASRAFQHATNALETMGSSSASNREADQPASFRSAQPPSQKPEIFSTNNTGGAMDWDNFLESSESTIQDDKPYIPPSMSSFQFKSLDPTETFPPQVQEQQYRQAQRFQQHDSHALESPFQTQAQFNQSQPVDLAPINHAAFLEYLKSTANYTTAPHAPALVHQYQHSYQPIHSNFNSSHDIQTQQQMDGGDILAFLDSTSYSDFVDQVETAGIEKHQQIRNEFVYSEATLGPNSRSLFSTLQLIQHLPSERQDIVQYLLQQGTYSDDIWGRPFGHDTEREEATSLAATRAEQDQFLQQQQSGDSTTEEMERVLKQIIDDAKNEVKTGDTNGKAVNRLMNIRSHLVMGTKL